MPAQLAVDFGNTNTVAAVADEGNVRILLLPDLGRTMPMEQLALVPTAVHVSEVTKRVFLMRRRVREVRIGQQALNQNLDNYELSGGFAHRFKPLLGGRSHQSVAKVGQSEMSAREVTALFLRELLDAARRQGLRSVDLTMPTPVGCYEPYRKELDAITRQLKIRDFRTIDEPVAAAVGYGINVAEEQTLLVVDFGGGTLDLAAVRLGPQGASGRVASVLAKHMVSLGGNDVDDWLLEHLVGMKLNVLPELEYEPLWEAMRVKEEAVRDGTATFRWRGVERRLSRDDLVCLLNDRGLYAQLREALEQIAADLEGAPIDQVLLVGGSTLLPDVPAVVDSVFPKAIVRHDPEYVFTAVASGAARFASGLPVADHIYHDYAVEVRDPRTHAVQYERLVPRRTRYPTPPDFAVRHYGDLPGGKEMEFPVYEVGRLGQKAVPWVRRPNGNEYWAPDPTTAGCLVHINPGDAPLPLRPEGKGTTPRLRVTYTIDASRWLRQTVEDLVRKETIRVNEPVVRLR
jgi:molecular chaperone DnaK (HSP70)